MEKKLSAKERLRLEKIFFSCLLAADPYTDWRPFTAEYPVTWRHFADRRHKALWRALSTFDLKNEEERRKAAEAELRNSSSSFIPGMDAPEDDLVRGQPGSAAEKLYLSKVEARSKAAAWLENKLGDSGALHLVGAREYLRELYALFPVSTAVKWVAGRLGLIPEEKPRNLCWNCALSRGVPPVMMCGQLGRHVGAADGYGCEWWQMPLNLYEKFMAKVEGEDDG